MSVHICLITGVTSFNHDRHKCAQICLGSSELVFGSKGVVVTVVQVASLWSDLESVKRRGFAELSFELRL